MSKRCIAEQLLLAFKAHGAAEIFGIPGDFALPYFKVIEETGILPLYCLSHEPGLGFAADAASRARCGLSVAAVTYGAGALNMVNPVATAHAEKSPVVVLSGGPGRRESAAGLLLHHQARTLDSQLAIFQEVTCAQTKLDDADRAPAEIARVLRAALSQSRPVYIELPRDMVTVPCDDVVPLPETTPDTDAVAACADEIIERLTASVQPVVMVGVEVRRFGLEDKVAQLIDRLGIPVVTSFLGRGLLAQTSARLVGTYLGVAGVPEVTDLVEHSDALLLLGVILSDTNLGVSGKHIDLRATMQALDGQVTLNYHTYAHIPLAALVDELLRRAPAATASRPTYPRQQYPRHMPEDDSAITPTDIATAVNDMMAEHGRFPIASDIGDCLFTALDMENTELMAPGYYATMGFGVPGGLGIQAATGRRPLILVGDGAFQMTGWELGNAARYGWDPIVLVFNNASWEMLRAFQPESKFNALPAWDFASLANHLGGDGVRVQTRAELARALRAAVSRRGKFQLLDIQIPKGVLSSTLARYVEGIKRRPR